MTQKTTELLEAALKLPAPERAQLVVELIASIDGEEEPGAEAAWAVEIEKRARRAIAGESNSENWDVVRERVQRKIQSWLRGG